MSRTEWGVVALLGLVLAPGVVALAGVWSSLDYYSHGFLVPVVALWAAYERGPRRGGRPPLRDPRGSALLCLALIVYGAGAVAGLPSLQGLGIVAAVAGAVLYLRGREGLRDHAFPVGFLLFMVPIPPPWLNPLILELQLGVSSAAVTLLRRFGVAVAREGNVLQLAGGGSLFVAEACSGITSIVTLTPLGVMLAYFTLRGLPRRLALVAAVVPLAMLANLLRVTVTVLAADAVGVERATGSALHESAGLITFLLSCAAMIGLAAALRDRRGARAGAPPPGAAGP